MGHPKKAINCPVCSESEPEIKLVPYPLFRHIDFSVFQPGPQRIGRCRRCGLVFRVIAESDQHDIDSIYRSEEYVRHEEPHTVVLKDRKDAVPMARLQAEMLAPFLGAPAASVLDIGCFDGQLLAEMETLCDASDLCGFDVAERPRFPRRKPFRFVCSRRSDIDGRFDLVTLSHSLQYVRDIQALFEDIRRLLKPFGKVFIQVPDFSRKPASLLLGDLYYHYTRDIVHNVLRHAGFESHFIASEHFPRDVLVMGSPRPQGQSAYSAPGDDLTAALQHLSEFSKRLDPFAAGDKVAVLGTTIDAAFVDERLGSKVAFFVDENPRKVGSTFHGKPIVHPASVADDDVVVIPMGMAGAPIRDRLQQKYRGHYHCV